MIFRRRRAGGASSGFGCCRLVREGTKRQSRSPAWQGAAQPAQSTPSCASPSGALCPTCRRPSCSARTCDRSADSAAAWPAAAAGQRARPWRRQAEHRAAPASSSQQRRRPPTKTARCRRHLGGGRGILLVGPPATEAACTARIASGNAGSGTAEGRPNEIDHNGRLGNGRPDGVDDKRRAGGRRHRGLVDAENDVMLPRIMLPIRLRLSV